MAQPRDKQNRFGFSGDQRYRLRKGRNDTYSNGKLLVWALKRHACVTWLDFFVHMRESSKCPDGRLQGFARWIEETLPWVAAHERIDPVAIMQFFKECELDLALLDGVTYNSYGDPRKDTVTDEERCIRNRTLLARLDRKGSLGGKTIEELLDEEVPIDGDRHLLRRILVETAPGSNGKFSKKSFRSACADRGFNPKTRVHNFRKLVAPAFEADLDVAALARVEDDVLILQPIVVTMWRAVNTALLLLQVRHRWPARNVLTKGIIAGVMNLRNGTAGVVPKVLVTYDFLTDLGRGPGGQLQRLNEREFLCEDDAEEIAPQEIWEAVLATYPEERLYSLPTAIGRKLKGRQLLSDRELNTLQESHPMARTKTVSADINAVRQILLALVRVMQIRYNWPGRSCLPVKLLQTALTNVPVQISMMDLDKAGVADSVARMEGGFLWGIETKEPDKIKGETKLEMPSDDDLDNLISSVYSASELEALVQEASRRLADHLKLSNEERAEMAGNRKTSKKASAKLPSANLALIAQLLIDFHALLMAQREWGHEGMLTARMVRNVAALVVPKIDTEPKTAKRAFQIMVTWKLIGAPLNVVIDGSSTVLYPVSLQLLESYEGEIPEDQPDTEDLQLILDELLPSALDAPEEHDAAETEESAEEPPKRLLGTVHANDVNALLNFQLLQRVLVEEFGWPYQAITSHLMLAALGHAYPFTKRTSLNPMGTKFRRLGALVDVAKVWRWTLMHVPTDAEFQARPDTKADSDPMTREEVREAIQSIFKDVHPMSWFLGEIDARVPAEVTKPYKALVDANEPTEPVNGSAIEDEPELEGPAMDQPQGPQGGRDTMPSADNKPIEILAVDAVALRAMQLLYRVMVLEWAWMLRDTIPSPVLGAAMTHARPADTAPRSRTAGLKDSGLIELLSATMGTVHFWKLHDREFSATGSTDRAEMTLAEARKALDRVLEDIDLFAISGQLGDLFPVEAQLTTDEIQELMAQGLEPGVTDVVEEPEPEPEPSPEPEAPAAEEPESEIEPEAEEVAEPDREVEEPEPEPEPEPVPEPEAPAAEEPEPPPMPSQEQLLALLGQALDSASDEQLERLLGGRLEAVVDRRLESRISGMLDQAQAVAKKKQEELAEAEAEVERRRQEAQAAAVRVQAVEILQEALRKSDNSVTVTHVAR